jgi:putative ABC transport system permease protein
MQKNLDHLAEKARGWLLDTGAWLKQAGVAATRFSQSVVKTVGAGGQQTLLATRTWFQDFPVRMRAFPGKLRQWTVQALHDVVVSIKTTPILLASFARHTLDFALSFNAMLVVVLKRLGNNLGISISAIIGIVAVMAMVVCVPVFSHAVSSQVLRSQLEEISNSTNRGLFSLHMYYQDSSSATPLNIDKVNLVTSYVRDTAQRLIGIRASQVITELQSSNYNWRPVKTQFKTDQSEPWFSMGFFSLEDLPKHATIVDGKWPEVGANDKPVQVAISETAADTFFLNVGDIYRFKTLQIEIAGIWRANDNKENYWFKPPQDVYTNMMWIPQQSFITRLKSVIDRPFFFVSWYLIMNESDMRFDLAPQYAKGIVRMAFEMKSLLPGLANDYSPLEPLNGYQKRAESLTTLFYAVGSPMVILALLFISLTATIAVQQYQQETATMRGRGTSWLQVVILNIIESVVLLVLALAPSLLAGWLAASLMDKTLSFLKFTNRAGIPFAFDGLNFLWLVVAAMVIIISRLTPVLGISRTSIVRMKQEQSRNVRRPLWERFYLDFLLLLPGIYAYVTMSGVAKSNALLAKLEAPMTGQYRDIVLYVAPALFAMALCMIMLRLLPLLLRVLGWLVERMPSVWAYLSIQQVARRPQDHSSALLLIMISLSLAIYSASTAKTLDRWLHDSEYYKSGADLAVHEYVLKGGSSTIPGNTDSSGVTLSEADLTMDSFINLDAHLSLPAVKAVTRVGKYNGAFSFGVGELPCVFMGIDRLDFPNVGFFRDDFSDQSFGALMNDLGTDLNAVLVPRSLALEKGLRIGDHLNSSVVVLDQTFDHDLVITGFYDYFATIYPGDTPTLIMNLDSVFDNPDAVVGYDIWMKLKPNSQVKVVTYSLQKLIGDRSVVQVHGNAFENVQKMMDQPERVGLFGILNVGFLMTGLMPGIGFVLYSYASLRRRFIQLGILQAIGLSVKQLIRYLASEQILLMGLAILIGAATGLVTSYLFVPFLQIGASTGTPIPPFEVMIGWAESGMLSLVFGIILSLTMIGTISSLVQMKVFQAVKMGESL